MFTLSARLHKILKKQGSLLESTISFVLYSNPQLCLDLDGKLGLDLHSRKIVKTGVGLLRLPSAASGCRLSGEGLASDIHNIYDTLHWVETKHWRFFCFGIRSAIFWHMKTGTFAESAHFHVPKNDTLDAKTKKRRPLFNANIPPKLCIAHLLYAIITFRWVLSQFSKIANFLLFVSRFYC